MGRSTYPRGLNLEQVGNKTAPGVVKREVVRLEPLHPIVALHKSMTTMSGVNQERLMNYACLPLVMLVVSVLANAWSEPKYRI